MSYGPTLGWRHFEQTDGGISSAADWSNRRKRGRKGRPHQKTPAPTHCRRLGDSKCSHMLSTAADHSILPKIATLNAAANSLQALKDLYDHETANTTITPENPSSTENPKMEHQLHDHKKGQGFSSRWAFSSAPNEGHAARFAIYRAQLTGHCTAHGHQQRHPAQPAMLLYRAPILSTITSPALDIFLNL